MPLTANGIEPDPVNFHAVQLGFNRGVPDLLIFQYTNNVGVTAYFAVLRRQQATNAPNNVSFLTVYRSLDLITWTAFQGTQISNPGVGIGGSSVQNVIPQVDGNTVYFIITAAAPAAPTALKMVTFNLDTLTYSAVSGGGPLAQVGQNTGCLFVKSGVARFVYGRTTAGNWGWFYNTWTLAGAVWGVEQSVITTATLMSLGSWAFNPANGDIGFWIVDNNVNEITVLHGGAWTAPLAFTGVVPNPSTIGPQQPGVYNSALDEWEFPSIIFNGGTNKYTGVMRKASPSANPVSATGETVTPDSLANSPYQYPGLFEFPLGTLNYTYVTQDNVNNDLQLLLTRRPSAGGAWSVPRVLWDSTTGNYVNPGLFGQPGASDSPYIGPASATGQLLIMFQAPITINTTTEYTLTAALGNVATTPICDFTGSGCPCFIHCPGGRAISIFSSICDPLVACCACIQ